LFYIEDTCVTIVFAKGLPNRVVTTTAAEVHKQTSLGLTIVAILVLAAFVLGLLF
jgi:hypothetical protein